MEIAKTVTHDSAYAKKKKAKHEVGNKTKRRKRKLDQIFEMSFDTDFDDPAENLINQVENIKLQGKYSIAKEYCLKISNKKEACELFFNILEG